jgi:hypothetical protein
MSSARAMAAGGWGIAALAMNAAAWGQSFDVERPITIVVGRPAGGARADRVDPARTGFANTTLPASALHAEWRASAGTLVEHAPLVDSGGSTYIVGAQGEVVSFGRDGAERWRTTTGALQPGPAALLSDETLVFVNAAGEAVAVRGGVVRWRSRFGRSDSAHPAPLPLDDGGVVVATTHELAALDADGRGRARTTLPEATTAPLVSALGKVVVVTTSGAVWAWTPGAPEPTRVGGFGSQIDGGAALSDDHTLVAVAAGEARIVALDLVRGVATTRAASPGGLWLGPPAMRRGTAYVLLLAPSGELALAIDPSGRELLRALLAVHPPGAGADGGAPHLVAGPHTSPLVDASGSMAFGTAGGGVGVVGASGTVETLTDACAAPPLAPASTLRPLGGGPLVAGLAPLGPHALVVACRSGAVLALTGGEASRAHL